MKRQMKLGFSVPPNGSHKGGWRYKNGWVSDGLDIESPVKNEILCD